VVYEALEGWSWTRRFSSMTAHHRASREDLIREYDRLMVQLVKQGSEPVVTDAVLDCFTDLELGLLVKDSALRLVRLRRLES